MVRLALVVAVVAACQGKDDRAPAARKDSAMQVADGGTDAEEQAPPIKDEPAEPVADPGKLIDDLGAVAAWQAVVDRAQYLARRGQHGVVFGTLGEATGDWYWLVDDTEGNGALAIRVQLGKLADKAKPADRVALGGAWALDGERRWYWKVDQVTALPPAPASDLKDPPSLPGHEIVMGNLPQGARPITLAKDGDAVYFAVTGRPPAIDGEGWPVADELGDPVFALLNLPGERPSFGGQDFRTPDERWQLKRGHVYWLRIGKIRKQAEGKPATINARTAPVRVK